MKSFLKCCSLFLYIFFASTHFANAQVAKILPFLESFNGGVFPPIGCSIYNPDENVTKWWRTTIAAFEGSASMSLDNLASDVQIGQLDRFQTPLIDFTSGVDFSTNFVFHYAYAPRILFGQIVSDTLSVVVSTDSGQTWTPMWSKSGSLLATAPALASSSGPSSFAPTASEWAKVEVNVGAFEGIESVVFGFENHSNRGGKIYIDNIVLLNTVPLNVNDINNAQVTLSPNPTFGNVKFQMEMNQNKKVTAYLYDMFGRIVWIKNFGTTQSISENISINDLSAGVYLLKVRAGESIYTRRITRQ